MPSLSVLILAAGKGTRMKSSLPKVLHTVGGKPLVTRVLETVLKLNPTDIGVVVGHGHDDVFSSVKKTYPKAKKFYQKVLDGSGGAVRKALSWIKKQKGDVLVACGDAPLFTTQTLNVLIKAHRRQKNAATVLSTIMDQPFGYGRIVRSFDDAVEKIVEQLDATHEEKKIQEINTGTYCFNAALLAQTVPQIKSNNAKKEYYLTDVLEILKMNHHRVGAQVCEDFHEALGINRRHDLALAEAVLIKRKLESLMAAGVTIMDPLSTYIDDAVKIGVDTVVWPQTFIKGSTTIGSGCQIGPWAYVQDCKIEKGVSLKATFADSAVIRREAKVGPFSRIRPNCDIGPQAHIGNFSELKNAVLKQGSKVNHLSYLGDAKVGKNVNIGAGTITCNYDGIKKSPTIIQDHAFIGSNVNLIAPITVGPHSVVGAGSSINEDVPAWSLVVERSKAVTKKDWAKQKFKKGK